jgi:hypothetical protein
MKKTYYNYFPHQYFFLLFSIFLSLFLTQSSIAQDITDKDSQLVTSKSMEMVKEYNQLLNLLISPDIDEATIKELIANSYAKNDPNAIFFSEKVIFEDDINPNHFDYNNVNDAMLGTYLKNFDLFLEKDKETSIIFSDIKASNVKLGDYLYVKVFFKSLFKAKNKEIKIPYRTTERVAEVRAEYVNDKWILYIMRISFVTPDDLANPYKNDLDIIETAKVGVGKMDTKMVLEEKAKRSIMEEERQNTILFQKSLIAGDSAVKETNYFLAIDSYLKANEILPDEKIIELKIKLVQALLETKGSNLGKKGTKSDEQKGNLELKKKINDALEKIALVQKQRLSKIDADNKVVIDNKVVPEQKEKSIINDPQKVSSPPSITQKTSNFKPLLGIKILAAVIGAFGAYNAYAIKNDYDTKLTALKNISATADPDGDGNIRTTALFSSWKTAYDDAQTAKDKQGTATASLGIAAVAVVVETLLFIRKKPSFSKGLSFKSNSQNIGFAFNYNF